MNRIRIAALAGLLLLAAGCSAPPEEAEDGYQVYYSALEDRYAQQALASEPYGSAPPEEPIPDLVAALLDGPDSPGLTSPFPDGVRLLGWELADGVLHLDLSEQYGGLSGVNLTVADACLTLTLCQVEGVDAVYVTVEGREIPYRPVQALTPEELFLSDGMDAPASVALPFWYPRADGTGLAAETRDAAVLIVAQRVSSIRHAHQIIVLHEGRMAGIGTHEELMKTCKVYQEIYESQTKEVQEA